ncbi:MAG TPA: hypothetical protein VI454_08870, partial [Verrucomicrobiae bacterium]
SQQQGMGGKSNQLAQASQGRPSGQRGEQSRDSQQPGEGKQGQQPGQQRGEREGQMAQAGQGQQPGQQSKPEFPFPGNSQQPGQQGGQEPGQSQSQQQANSPLSSQQPGGRGQPQSGQRSDQMQAGANTQRGDAQRGGDRAGGVLRELGQRTEGGWLGGWGGGATDIGPIRGEGFIDWSDRLRNVEEMLERPELRNEAARIREIAKAMRVEFKRHSKEPKWDLVQLKISTPLAELRRQVNEELARLEGKDALVPIDRDPVPGKFSELVRRYYERLGSDQ